MKPTLLPLVTAVAAIAAPSARAQFNITTPPGYETLEGNVNNLYPFGRALNSMRYQQIYDSSNFTQPNVPGFPIIINRLRFRANAAVTTSSWTGGSWPNVQLRMATSPVDHLNYSMTFANNLGTDLTTVYQGQVTVLPGSGRGLGIPGQVIVDIQLTTPFTYDPTTGNDLTLDVILDGTGWTGQSFPADADNTTAANCSRVYDETGILSPVANDGQQNFGLVTEFGYVPASGVFAVFGATPTRGPSPLTVQFTDNSYTSDPAGILSWAWDFDGDTVVDSTLQNPQHVFSCGTWSVSLTVTAANGQHTLTRPNLVVTDEVQAGFTQQTIGNALVQFTDTTTPPATAWAWDFDGDSVVDSTLQNPVWQYPSSCSGYSATLTASRLCGPSGTATRTVITVPNSLTTLVTGGNGLNGSGAGNLFDLTVLNPQGVNVCGITMAPYAASTVSIGAPLTCDVYMTDAAGGYAGNHANVSVWRLVATGSGVYRGGTFNAPVPTFMGLNTPLFLTPGTYGVAVHMTGCGVAYTNGTNQTFSNADLSITAGSAKSVAFSATQTANRVWNGILHYDTAATGASAGYGFFGAGCANSQSAISRLTANQPPALGTTASITVDNLPVGAAIMMLGFSKTISTLGPLPLDLTPLGAPGCYGRVRPDASSFLFGPGGQATWSLGIPVNPVLIAMPIFQQALVVDPLANTFGGVVSDAVAGMIGN